MLRPVSNPPNPWLTTEVEYLDDPPAARLEVYEDNTREILAHNDSPDLGFSWSVNPYRGCFHACAYCISGDTPILMGDGTTRPMQDLRAGDVIYGTERRGDYRRYVKTQVVAHWSTVKPAFRIVLEDGTTLTASGDHRFLSRRGWKHVTNSVRRDRAHLTPNDRLLGTGAFATSAEATPAYRRGYLCGIIRGDGLIGHYAYARRGRKDQQHQFRLALIDFEALRRTRGYLLLESIETQEFVFQKDAVGYAPVRAIRTSAKAQVEKIERIVSWPDDRCRDWTRGFLAGIFDAEGSYSGGILRISNTDPVLIEETWNALVRLGFDCVAEREPRGRGHPAASVRVRRGLREHLRFFHTTDPAISRKRTIEGTALKAAAIRVTSVEPLGLSLPLYDITTETGDFIANGVVSHNCYARPSHEYLGFGAGTDFDRKITVKPDAPRLLRDAFNRPSWKGELVVFSGVTDCYQPLEASYRVTRGCLEVCAEYRNPAGIITKSPLIERDLDVLRKLAAETDLHVTVSIPLWNREHAHAIEPQVASPERRMQTIAKLAAAGIDVGVNVAPVIPGLSDAEIPRILEEAHKAGARRAGYVFLRLPGSVAQVFEQRIREALPLRADRILSRVREARGGKLYDSRWGVRGRGQGEYADVIRTLFDSTVRRLGMNQECIGADRGDTFRRPGGGRQLPLL